MHMGKNNNNNNNCYSSVTNVANTRPDQLKLDKMDFNQVTLGIQEFFITLENLLFRGLLIQSLPSILGKIYKD